jgi:transcriptional regulator with XRE-family HTH domain
MAVPKSLFANVLTHLLDRTDLFTRQEWAEFLKVTPAAISQWVNDKTIPSPELLRMIVSVLRESDGVPAQLLSEFDRVAQLPSAEISPHGDRLDRTLADYLLRPLLKGFFAIYEPLPASLKERVLRESSELCRSLKRARRQEHDTRSKLSESPAAEPGSPATGHRDVVKRAQPGSQEDVVSRLVDVVNRGEVYEFAGAHD